jgi:hypothetical protein
MNEIGKHELLTAAEEVALARELAPLRARSLG